MFDSYNISGTLKNASPLEARGDSSERFNWTKLGKELEQQEEDEEE